MLFSSLSPPITCRATSLRFCLLSVKRGQSQRLPMSIAMKHREPNTQPGSWYAFFHKACFMALTSLGGGPSTVIETRFSPRSSTRPRTRFSSLSACFEFFGLKTGLRKETKKASVRKRVKFMVTCLGDSKICFTICILTNGP